MIYTVTMNPSLDYWMAVPRLAVGATNRAAQTGISYGGKGLNVSATLHKLGMPSVAVALIAGWTGEALAGYVREVGLDADFILSQDANALTRINVKLRGDATTECNAPGFVPTAEDLAALEARLAQARSGDTVVLAGSLPRGVGADFYGKAVEALHKRGVRVVVDCDGEALRHAVESGADLVKPNRAELEAWAGKSLTTDTDVIGAARRMQRAGAARVLVSLGADGALLLDADGTFYRAAAIRGDVLQTVGAGDALLAGFLYGEATTGNVCEALRFGTAAAAAVVFDGEAATGARMRELYAGL